ncbi:tetratricopeptide repeat protein [Roseateles sp. P5_E4]
MHRFFAGFLYGVMLLSPSMAAAGACDGPLVERNSEARSAIELVERKPFNELLSLAVAGNASAQNMLGVIYGMGQGVPHDSEKSAHWYSQAANAGLAVSQANLAFMYFKGEGVPKNDSLAFYWAEKATAQGHFQGRLTLGHFYRTGIGVKQDRAEARKCYFALAIEGNLRAQQALMSMDEEESSPRK